MNYCSFCVFCGDFLQFKVILGFCVVLSSFPQIFVILLEFLRFRGLPEVARSCPKLPEVGVRNRGQIIEMDVLFPGNHGFPGLWRQKITIYDVVVHKISSKNHENLRFSMKNKVCPKLPEVARSCPKLPEVTARFCTKSTRNA